MPNKNACALGSFERQMTVLPVATRREPWLKVASACWNGSECPEFGRPYAATSITNMLTTKVQEATA